VAKSGTDIAQYASTYFHISMMEKLILYTELFYIIPTLFPYFLPF